MSLAKKIANKGFNEEARLSTRGVNKSGIRASLAKRKRSINKLAARKERADHFASFAD